MAYSLNIVPISHFQFFNKIEDAREQLIFESLNEDQKQNYLNMLDCENIDFGLLNVLTKK